MIIGINGNEANVTHRVGVGQYVFELLKHLEKYKEASIKYKVYLQNPAQADLPNLDYKVLSGKGLWTLTSLQKEVLINRPDVLFTPTHYTPLFLTCPSVISIMDLGYERFPQYFKKKDLYQLKYWTRLSVNQASKILAISEFTKKEIMEIYKVPEEKVVVTPLAYDKDRFNLKVKKSTKYGEYFLFLGTLQPRKNIERLIAAYKLLKTDCKLVITGMINEGRGGWMNDNIRASENIILTGYLPDSELPGLYAGAKAYILPSLYEGFGIPPLEAMACGTPVCVSKVSSLPEICGDAATYIDDPYNINSIKDALEEVLKNGNKKVNSGLERVKRYNWSGTANLTINTIKSVIQ